MTEMDDNVTMLLAVLIAAIATCLIVLTLALRDNARSGDRQNTERTTARMQACGAIADESLRVLCVVQASQP